jgi:hypothetical protein
VAKCSRQAWCNLLLAKHDVYSISFISLKYVYVVIISEQYMCHNFRQSRFLSLFGWRSGGGHRRSSSHHRSTFHFPFVLSCLPTHLVSIPSWHVVYLTLCPPPCLCAELFIVSACARFLWVLYPFACCSGSQWFYE